MDHDWSEFERVLKQPRLRAPSAALDARIAELVEATAAADSSTPASAPMRSVEHVGSPRGAWGRLSLSACAVVLVVVCGLTLRDGRWEGGRWGTSTHPTLTSLTRTNNDGLPGGDVIQVAGSPDAGAVVRGDALAPESEWIRVRQVTETWFDQGIHHLDEQTPLRQYRGERLERLIVSDPNGEWEFDITVPVRQTVFVEPTVF